MPIKQQAIDDAQKRADLTKRDHIVFRYIEGINVQFDYTPTELWDKRRHRQPVVTKVTIVKPTTTDTI
jgi:hypothetical protein